MSEIKRRNLIHPTKDDAPKDQRWWLDEFVETRGERVTQVAAELYRRMEPHRQGMWRWAGLYANDPFLSTQLGFSPRSKSLSQNNTRTAPLSLNAVKAVSDTYVALVTDDRPKVSAVTSGGSWELQQKAAALEKFIGGVFYENDIYTVATLVNYDVVKCGTGIIKVADDRPRKTHIKMQRIFPWDILADPDDAMYGNPQCLYELRRIPRVVAQEYWPEKADDIARCTGDFSTLGNETSAQLAYNEEYVYVVEAWRRSPAEGVPGLHVIVVGDVVLFEEEWNRDSFPFVFFYRQRPTEGIWGISLGQELSGLQLAVNKLLRDIQRAQNLVVGHYLIENSTQVNTGNISDRIGGFIRYRGTKPEYVAPPPVPDQTIMYLQQLWGRCFETIGISQQAAQSQKPAGLNSGKAIMVYADIQSQRFKPSYVEYQNAFIELGKQVIATAREMDETFYVHAAGRSTMTTVSWADAGGLEDSEFALKLYPTNALADDPASRLQQVQDLMVAKLLTDKQGRRLLDMPDLEALNDYENASYNLVMKIQAMILNGEEDAPGPEPFMDLVEAIQTMQLGYLKAKLGGAKPDRLAKVSDWIAAAKQMLDEATAPPPGAAPPPTLPGAPPGLMGALPPAPGMPQRQVGGPLAPGAPPPLQTVAP